jgi:hypothetical protein
MDETLDATPETETTQLDAIDKATLAPLVRSALNSVTAEVISWSYAQLRGGAGGGTVYRFSGEGHDQGRTLPWSLILKVLQLAGKSADISAGNYYRREADAYRSGWLDDLPGHLAAPICYGVTDHLDGTCWIWLEDVTDDIGAPWPLEHYGVVARHLGQFNGAYLVDRPVPTWPWLSSDGLRRSIVHSAPGISLLRDSLDHPLIRRQYTGNAAEKKFRIWAERDLYLDALDRLPQTICHRDAFHRNLFARRTASGDYQTVAIDWAFVGLGAVGMELVPLVQAGLGFFEIDLAQAQDLEDIAFDGYLQGLRDAGWRGDPRQARLGYAAASLYYYLMFGALPMLLDENLHGWFEQIFGRSAGECCDLWAQMGSFISRRIDEARELIEVLG